MSKKKKKEKIIYVDDGSTVADMSNVSGGRRMRADKTGRTKSSLKEQWQTYKDAVKMMIVPMLVVVGTMIVLYMLLSLFFYLT